MLEYLLTSKTKLSLLNLLWKNRLRATASELARLSNLSFPTVHAELQQMEQYGFAKSEPVGNSRLYFANLDFPHANLLTDLLNTDQPVDPNSNDNLNVAMEDVVMNMSYYGAPLGNSGKPSKKFDLEFTVAHALKLAHTNPTVARSLPVLLFVNKDKLDLQKLRYCAERLDEKQTLGFFLDLTSQLVKVTKYKSFAAELFDKRIKKEKNFFYAKEGNFARQLTERNTPSVAKKWKFLMNMELNTFQSLFNKFSDMSA